MTANQDTDGGEKPASLWQQLKAFDRVYWIANWMELIERFAYYGVRVSVPLFMLATFEQGGLQLDHIQKGSIFAIWAVVQSFVPVVSGGIADRYGFKVNLFASTVLKIIGYLMMGFTVPVVEWLAGMPIEEARAAGNDQTYVVFLLGAVVLALGTAIFKPGLQGLLALKIPKKASALGWGVFFQMVNVGAFLGPLIMGKLRTTDWTYLFIAGAIAIALNFIPLFMFKEPEREVKIEEDGPLALFVKAIKGLLEPRLFFFTISFAGFWALAMQFFDLLPNFISDWVDSRMLVDFLQKFMPTDMIPIVEGGNLAPEWLGLVNALVISFFAFLVGFLTGRISSLATIILGIITATIAMYCLTFSMNGWWIICVIIMFSFGEMMAAMTTFRYLTDIAPKGKEGLYMGYSNFTMGIGWSLGSVLAGSVYEDNGDKINLAKQYLVQQEGMAAAVVEDVPEEGFMTFFQEAVGTDAWGARALLWETYAPYSVWQVFAWIGVGALVAISIYNFVVRKADKDPGHSFNVNGRLWVRVFLAPICIAIIAAFIYEYDKSVPTSQALSQTAGLALNGVFFLLMLVMSFLDDGKSEPPKPV